MDTAYCPTDFVKLQMEYRIHSKNNTRISVIGIDISNLMSNSNIKNKSELNELLNYFKEKCGNFIYSPHINSQLLNDIVSWEQVNSYEFIKSISIGYTDVYFNEKNQIADKKDLFVPRFEHVEKQVKEIISEHDLSQIDFLTLYYPKSTALNVKKLNNDIDLLKKQNLVNSFGIHCQYLSDALNLSKFLNIDHIFLEIDINTSSEIINSIFKVTNSKNISVFCFLKKFDVSKNNIVDNYFDSVENLLFEGLEKVNNKIKSDFQINSNEISTLTLRKLFDENFQSFVIPISTKLELDHYIRVFLRSYLSSEEKINLQSLLQPTLYESPKKKH